MTKAKIIVIAALSALALAGCQKETTHSVDWYKSHDQQRTAKLAECKNDPGDKEASPNCINAQKAADAKVLSRRGFVQPVMPK